MPVESVLTGERGLEGAKVPTGTCWVSKGPEWRAKRHTMGRAALAAQSKAAAGPVGTAPDRAARE